MRRKVKTKRGKERREERYGLGVFHCRRELRLSQKIKGRGGPIVFQLGIKLNEFTTTR